MSFEIFKSFGVVLKETRGHDEDGIRLSLFDELFGLEGMLGWDVAGSYESELISSCRVFKIWKSGLVDASDVLDSL